MKKISYILWILILFIPPKSFADDKLIDKKILYIASYVHSHERSAVIECVIEEELAHTGVQLSRGYWFKPAVLKFGTPVSELKTLSE
ncbi:MAG: hypothetical protein PHP00_11895 [Thiotrichaceae bacterium]|nr:hypothetical protein [Thiotrichaceae bacterium]